MVIFPVTDSTLSAPHLALFLQEKYGFDESTTCKIFRTGINHTYLVTGQEIRYVFRVYSYQWRTETEIAEELRVLDLLREKGFRFPIPSRTKITATSSRFRLPKVCATASYSLLPKAGKSGILTRLLATPWVP